MVLDIFTIIGWYCYVIRSSQIFGNSIIIIKSRKGKDTSVSPEFKYWIWKYIVTQELHYLFQYELSYRNETGTHHHALVSTSVWCFKIFLGFRLHGGSLPNFNFFNANPQIFQRNRKVPLSICVETNFHNISNINLRIIRRRNYN